MTQNKVLETTAPLIRNPRYVDIDNAAIEAVALRYSREDLQIPSWREPVFLNGSIGVVMDYFFVGNAINFAFMDFQSREKFSTQYKGQEWRGAYGMWACLKREMEEGYAHILDGWYLEQFSGSDMMRIFEGNIRIPMFQQRIDIFHEVGRVLSEKYNGNFHNLVKKAGNRLFNNGQGLVERLTSEFPSFDDSVVVDGKVVRFDKRAQLLPAMIYGRFQNQDCFQMEDINELTVFADYALPVALRSAGILIYEQSLRERIDKQELVPAGSQEELEIRASTIHACKRLVDRINQFRTEDGQGQEKVNSLHVDAKLWFESRKASTPHHLTITTAY